MTKSAPLGEVAEINPRQTLDFSSDEPVSFIPMAGVQDGGGGYTEEERPYKEVQRGYTAFKSGDILFAKITPCMENAKVALLNGLAHRAGFGSTEFHVVRAGSEADARYLFHFLWNPRFRAVAERNMTGSAGQKRVPVGFLKDFKLPLPPLDKQRRIAAILDKADAIRRRRRQALAEIDNLLRATFLDMFGDPGRDAAVPTKPLVEFVDPSRPITYGILKPGTDQTDGVPYIRVVDMQEGRVLTDQVRRTTAAIAHEYRRSTLKAGDLLMSIRGHVGRYAFVPCELEGANITQDTARLSIPDENDALFVRACLESPGMQRLMVKLTKGGAVKGINLSDVRDLPVPVTCAMKREHFARIARQCEGKKSRARAAVVEAEELFGSLSQRAFKGDL